MSFVVGGQGTPFVLIHGMPGCGLRWEPVGRKLAEHYQVIIPDLLGFGESGTAGDDYYMEGQARALKALLDGSRVDELYLGLHDFGVPVGLTLIRLFPDLNVKGLVICDAHVFSDTFRQAPFSLRVGAALGRRQTFTHFLFGTELGLRMMHNLYTKNKIAFPWARFRSEINPQSMETAARIAMRIGEHFVEDYEAVESVLLNLTARTLILWGASDPVALPTTARRLNYVIRHSAVKVYEDSGHFLPEERPEEVARDIIAYFGMTP